jgi:hypothetical protein
MKIINNYIISLILIVVTSFFSNLAFAKEYNYCSEKGKKISIISIIPKNFSENKKNKLVDTFVAIKKNISPGDEVTLSIAKKDNLSDVFKKCFPGCPPSEGFVSQMFGLGEDCNATRMMAAKKKFDILIRNEFRKIYNYKEQMEDGVSDIFSSLDIISNFNKNNDFTQTYILHSMNPFQSSVLSKEKLDTLYIELIQQKRIPKKWPDATYASTTPNSKLINFWKDLFKINKQNFIYK